MLDGYCFAEIVGRHGPFISERIRSGRSLVDRARLEDDGASLMTDLRVDRENMFAGLLQKVEGMRIGGRRKLKISPHLAYGESGIPGRIPPQAVIIAEIEFIEEPVMHG